MQVYYTIRWKGKNKVGDTKNEIIINISVGMKKKIGINAQFKYLWRFKEAGNEDFYY